MRKVSLDQEKDGGKLIDCISVENMRQSDAHTIENFIPSLELMWRAAVGVFKAVNWKEKNAIVVGAGNNGGDGFALACILKENGFQCTVFTVGQHLSSDSAYYARKAEEDGIDIVCFEPNCLKGYDVIVDCLLGTGFQGELRENYRTAIEAINRSDSYVVSVDINSGMNGDTGEAQLAVCSDVTVTIGYVKRGLVTENAGTYIKKLICVDIGIVLIREEDKICDKQEWEQVNEHSARRYYRCPGWLNMNILKAY